MAKKVLSIQTGICWTKVALMEYGAKHPRVLDVFTFRSPDNSGEDPREGEPCQSASRRAFQA